MYISVDAQLILEQKDSLLLVVSNKIIALFHPQCALSWLGKLKQVDTEGCVHSVLVWRKSREDLLQFPEYKSLYKRHCSAFRHECCLQLGSKWQPERPTWLWNWISSLIMLLFFYIYKRLYYNFVVKRRLKHTLFFWWQHLWKIFLLSLPLNVLEDLGTGFWCFCPVRPLSNDDC